MERYTFGYREIPTN